MDRINMSSSKLAEINNKKLVYEWCMFVLF